MVRRGQETSDGESSAVKVFVRVRPHNTREKDAAAKKGDDIHSIIHMSDRKVEVMCPERHTPKHSFHFDACLWSIPPEEVKKMKPAPKANTYLSQAAVFQECGQMMVNNSLDGYNSCLFAYGQTGSGKTFTMMGKRSDTELQGIIPRLCAELFQRTNSKREKTKYKIKVSYLEIYNEMVRDLLVEKRKETSLRVRQDPTTGTYVEDLLCHEVASQGEVFKWMERGDQHRATAETKMNQASSRSHAIFTLVISQFSQDDSAEGSKSAKLHLVDLAGSERVALSGAEGAVFKEATKINQSLTNLGRVIDALADLANNVKSVFPPYRDSMLTWILCDSLGGNSKTAMIATVSPSEHCLDETLNTLRYASRAREIVNIAVVNEDSSVAKIKELEARVEYFRKQLREAGGSGIKHRLQDLEDTIGYQQSVISKLEKEKETLVKEKALRMQKQSSRSTADAEAIKKLEAKAKKKSKEVGDMKEDYVAMKEEQRVMVEKLAQADKKVADSKKKLKEQKEAWERELQDIQAQRDSLQKDDALLKKREKKNQEHIKDLEAQVAKLEQEAQGADELNAELMDEKDAADEEITELKQQVAELKISVEKKEASLKSAREETKSPLSSPRALAGKYESEIDALKMRLDNAAQSRSTMIERMNEMKETMHGLETEKSKHEREAESLTLKLSVAQDELNEAAEELKREREDHEATKARKAEFLKAQKAAEEQHEYLQSQILAADDKAAQLKVVTEADKAKIQSLQDHLASVQDEASTFEMQMLEAQGDLREAEEERAKLFEQVQMLEEEGKEKAEKMEATIAKLREEAEKQYGRADTAEGEVTELEADLAELRGRFEEKVEKEKELHLSLAGMKRKYDEHLAASTSEHEALEGRVSELQAQLRAAEDAHAALKTAHGELEAARQVEAQAAASKSSDLTATIDGLRKAGQDAEDEIAALTADGEGKQATIDAARARIEALEEKLAQAETSGAAVKNTLTAQVDAAEQTIAGQKKELAALTASLETTTAQLKETEAEGTRDKAFATAQTNELQGEIAQLKADLAKTQDSLANTTGDYERAAREQADSVMKLGELQSELKGVQASLADTEAAAAGDHEKAASRMKEQSSEIARLEKLYEDEKAVANATLEQRVDIEAKLRDEEAAAAAATEAHQAELAQRDAAIAKKEAIIEDLEKAVQTKAENMAQMSAESAKQIAAMSDTCDKLNKDLNEKLTELAATAASLEELQTAHTAGEAQHAAAMADLQRQFTDATATITARDASITALTRDRDEHEAVGNERRAQLDALEARRADEQAQAGAAREALEGEVAALKEANGTLEAAKTALEDTVRVFEQVTVPELQKDIAAVRGELSERVQTLSELRAEQLRLETEAARRGEALAAAEARAAALEAELSATQEKEHTLENRKLDLEQEVEDLRRETIEAEAMLRVANRAAGAAEVVGMHDMEGAERGGILADEGDARGELLLEATQGYVGVYLPRMEKAAREDERQKAAEDMAGLQMDEINDVAMELLQQKAENDRLKDNYASLEQLMSNLKEAHAGPLAPPPAPMKTPRGLTQKPSMASLRTRTDKDAQKDPQRRPQTLFHDQEAAAGREAFDEYA